MKAWMVTATETDLDYNGQSATNYRETWLFADCKDADNFIISKLKKPGFIQVVLTPEYMQWMCYPRVNLLYMVILERKEIL